MAVLLAANASFMPGPPEIVNPDLSAFRWGIEELNGRAADYGYGGLELHWARAQHCRELRDASPEEAQIMARGIVAAHEGWRKSADPHPADPEETPLRPLSERGSLAVRLGSVMLFPTAAGSLDSLAAVEQKLDRDQPWHYVLFPDEHGDRATDLTKTERFPFSSIQPTVDVTAAWGIDSISGLIDELRARGFKATIDSFHISRQGKIVSKTPRWQAWAERLLDTADMVPEVHVSLGRNDFENVDAERYAKSVAEMKALIENGNLDATPLGELVGMLNDRRWTGNVVVEATMPGLKATFGKLTPKLVAELHAGMTAGIKRVLPHIVWDAFPSKASTTT
jgi:hypothetical protein